MNIYKKISSLCFLGLSCLFLSQTILADNVPIDRKITLVRTYDTWAVIKFEPSFSNNLGCASPSNAKNEYAVINWQGDASKKAMYASALVAYTTGNKIGLGIIGCWSRYGGGVPLVYRIDMASNN